MSKKLIISFVLVFFSGLGHAQEPAESSADAGPADVQSSPMSSITSMGDQLSEMIAGFFMSIEALTSDDKLIAAIKDEDETRLKLLADNYQKQLENSLKVRIYIKDKEEVDSATMPACGFACIEMVRTAYIGEPDAEALLFRSPDANITLSRGIKDTTGTTIGAIVVQYPYTLLKSSIAQLTDSGLFTELRQYVAGPPVVLFNHGDRTTKQGTAQKIMRISGTRWVLAVWTPGGVAVEEYEPPALPWMYIIMGIAVLLGGITLLVIYKIKRPAPARAKKSVVMETYTDEAISYDQDHESKTLIMGGGASEVDVSKYLKDNETTNIKMKIK